MTSQYSLTYSRTLNFCPSAGYSQYAGDAGYDAAAASAYYQQSVTGEGEAAAAEKQAVKEAPSAAAIVVKKPVIIQSVPLPAVPPVAAPPQRETGADESVGPADGGDSGEVRPGPQNTAAASQKEELNDFQRHMMVSPIVHLTCFCACMYQGSLGIGLKPKLIDCHARS